MVRIKETLNIGPIKVFLEYSFSFAGSSVWFFGSDYEFLFGFQTGDSNLISISVLTNKKKVQNLGSDGSLVVNQALAISNCWEKKLILTLKYASNLRFVYLKTRFSISSFQQKPTRCFIFQVSKFLTRKRPFSGLL